MKRASRSTRRRVVFLDTFRRSSVASESGLTTTIRVIEGDRIPRPHWVRVPRRMMFNYARIIKRIHDDAASGRRRVNHACAFGGWRKYYYDFDFECQSSSRPKRRNDDDTVLPTSESFTHYFLVAFDACTQGRREEVANRARAQGLALCRTSRKIRRNLRCSFLSFWISKLTCGLGDYGILLQYLGYFWTIH